MSWWVSRNENLKRLVQLSQEKTQALKKSTVIIGGEKIEVEVVDTPEKREKGLSGRASLDKGKGMLFKFSPDTVVSFWMKGMKFPIDIIWINDERVAKIDEKLPLPDEGKLPKRYPSPGGVDFVLEVPAGYAVEAGIKVKDQITFENI